MMKYKNLLGSFIIFVVIIIMYKQRNRSFEYEIVNNIKGYKLNGKIIKKLLYMHLGDAKGDYIMINNDTLHMFRLLDKNIHRTIAKEISISDSVSKKANCDTIYFFTSSGYFYLKTIIVDSPHNRIDNTIKSKK